MIKKLIKIKGVGKFENYLPKAVTKFSGIFNNIVLIYGINGSGKSTFAAIVRSLKGDNSIVSKRKTFKSTGNPEVEILVDGISKPFAYENNTWSDFYPNIEIFDSQFINENVYTGFSVESDQKRKLFDIILGQPGIILKQRIEKIKSDIKDEQTKLQQISASIIKHVGYAIDSASFNSQVEIPEIAKRIEEKESEIKTCQSFEEIKNSNTLKLIDFAKLDFDFEKIKKVLEKTVNSISEEYLQKVEEHKDHFPIDNQTEQWIKLGYDNINENSCPFCERKFDASIDIVKAYSQYFNEEYLQLQNDSKELNDLFVDFNLPLIINEIELTISTNTVLVDFWKQHTKIDYYDEVILQNKKELIDSFSGIQKIIQNKVDSPLKIQETKQLIDFQQNLEDEISRFKECNKIIIKYIDKINELKKTPTKSIPTLQDELKSLMLNQSRVSEAGKDLAKKYSDIITKIDSLNYDKDAKQEELRKYTIATLKSYRSIINDLLKKFATYMEIKEIKSVYVGASKVPSVEYRLSVSGNNVQLNDDGINPCFKYVLSDGDKSALALSFFLATLIVGKDDLPNKIILFDDPVASFDSSRQFETIKALHWIGSNAKQLMVLTHNLHFAGEFYYQYQNRSTIQPLQFFQANNQTYFEDFLIEVETLPDILKDLDTIQNYLIKGAKDESEKIKIKRCLRPVLEGYFKMKFFGLLQENDWLGGFIKKVRESKQGDKLFRLQTSLEKIESVNDWTKESHHGSISQTTIDNGELRTHTEMVLDLIENI
jgi:wobble nucleotide-excising tRNase